MDRLIRVKPRNCIAMKRHGRATRYLIFEKGNRALPRFAWVYAANLLQCFSEHQMLRQTPLSARANDEMIADATEEINRNSLFNQAICQIIPDYDACCNEKFILNLLNFHIKLEKDTRFFFNRSQHCK